MLACARTETLALERALERPEATVLPNDTPPVRSFRAWEWVLCVTVIILKLVVLSKSWGVLSGYDIGDHLDRVERAEWLADEPRLNEHFYGYHPPLGFYAAHGFMSFGLSSGQAVQSMATLSSLALFLFLRATCRRLGFLDTRHGVVWLYIAVGMPICVHSGASINHDIHIAAISAFILWVATFLFGGHAPTRMTGRVLVAVCAVTILALGLLTKYSAILPCVLLPLAAFFIPQYLSWRSRLLCASKATLLAGAAVVLVFPYYWKRYYQPHGEFFPYNYSWYTAEVDEVRQKRDADIPRFLTQLLAPSWLQSAREPTLRDLETVRMSDAWRDFWVQDTQSLPFGTEPAVVPATPRNIGIIYMHMAELLVMLGAIRAIQLCSRKQRSTWTAWEQMGMITLLYAALLAGALLKFAYDTPLAWCAITKGIYILPASWGIAWLIAEALRMRRETTHVENHLFCLGVLGWLAVNHLVPVY